MTCGLCRDCKYWGDVENDGGRACNLQFIEGPDALIWPEQYDMIFTAPDFGCVQFEAKV